VADSVLIPKDPEKRAALAQMAGLTDEERLALDKWCAAEQRQYESRRRAAMERLADTPMAEEA
jgi:hypothetical protein